MKEYTIKVGKVFTQKKADELIKYLEQKERDMQEMQDWICSDDFTLKQNNHNKAEAIKSIINRIGWGLTWVSAKELIKTTLQNWD